MGWDPSEAAPGIWDAGPELQAPTSKLPNVFVPSGNAVEGAVGTASAVVQARLALERRIWAETGVQGAPEDWSRAWPCSTSIPDADPPVVAMTWSADASLGWPEANFSKTFAADGAAEFPVAYMACEEGRAWTQNEWDFRDSAESLPEGSQELAQCAPGQNDPAKASNHEELLSVGTETKRKQKGRSHNVVPRSVNLAEQYASRPDGTTVTTLMLRNVPNTFNRREVMNMIDLAGFKGKYNFLYLPIDTSTRLNVGYAFVNFEEPEIAAVFWTKMQGSKYPERTKRQMLISAAHIQGLEKNLEHLSVTSVLSASEEQQRPWFRTEDLQVEATRTERQKMIWEGEETEVVAGCADMAGGPVASRSTEKEDESEAATAEASAGVAEAGAGGDQQALALLDGTLQINSPRGAPSSAWQQYVGHSRSAARGGNDTFSSTPLAPRGSAAPRQGRSGARSVSAHVPSQRAIHDREAPAGATLEADAAVDAAGSRRRRHRASRSTMPKNRVANSAAADVSAGIALDASASSRARSKQASRSLSKSQRVPPAESPMDEAVAAAAKEAAAIAFAAAAARRGAEAWVAANAWCTYGGPDPWFSDPVPAVSSSCPADKGVEDVVKDSAATMNSQAAPFTPGCAAWMATDGSMPEFNEPKAVAPKPLAPDHEPATSEMPACQAVAYEAPKHTEASHQVPDPKAVSWEVPSMLVPPPPTSVPSAKLEDTSQLQCIPPSAEAHAVKLPEREPASWEIPAVKEVASWEVPALEKALPKALLRPVSPPRAPESKAVAPQPPTRHAPESKAGARGSQAKARASKAAPTEPSVRQAKPAPPPPPAPAPPGFAREEDWPALGAIIGRQSSKNEAGRRRRVSRPRAKGLQSKKAEKPRPEEATEAPAVVSQESLQDVQTEEAVVVQEATAAEAPVNLAAPVAEAPTTSAAPAAEAPAKAAAPAAEEPLREDAGTEPSSQARSSPPQYSRLQLLMVGARLGLLHSSGEIREKIRGSSVPGQGAEAFRNTGAVLPVLASVLDETFAGTLALGTRPDLPPRSTSMRPNSKRAPSARGSQGRRRSVGACEALHRRV